MSWLKRFKHEIRENLGRSPDGVAFVSRFAHWREELVREDSAICIEGYPRSANTFSVAALLVSQPGFEGHIARHTHLCGQVLRAVRFGVPTLVVIREPIAAACSLRIFAPWMTAKQCLRDYHRFYSGIAPAASDLALLRFEDITGDYNHAIDALNRKFDMGLAPYGADKDTEDRCFEMVEDMDRKFRGDADVSEASVARPSAERERAKQEVASEMDAPELASLRASCTELYEKLQQSCEPGGDA